MLFCWGTQFSHASIWCHGWHYPSGLACWFEVKATEQHVVVTQLWIHSSHSQPLRAAIHSGRQQCRIASASILWWRSRSLGVFVCWSWRRQRKGVKFTKGRWTWWTGGVLFSGTAAKIGGSPISDFSSVHTLDVSFSVQVQCLCYQCSVLLASAVETWNNAWHVPIKYHGKGI